MRKTIKPLLLSLAIGLISNSALADKASNTFRFASTNPINAIDPYYNAFREAILVVGQLTWDTLIYADPESDGYKGLLAKSWQWIDNKTIDFELRDDVKFHDGVPLTADDVVYTLNYVSNPENKVTVQANVKWIERAEKLDAYKVRVFLKGPFPAALEYFAGPLAILPVDFFGADQKAGGNGRLVGTGPYKITKFVPGDRVELELNENYIKDGPKGQPSIGKIEYRMIPDRSTQMAELMSGGVDWVWYLSKDETERLATSGNIQTATSPSMRLDFVSFDAAGKTGKDGPMTDLRVREALTMALDREKIAKQLQGEQSWVPSGACYVSQFGCVDNLPKLPYDPDAAKKLLKDAGYPDGFDLDLYSYDAKPLAEVIVAYWQKVGVRAKLHFMQYPAVREKILAGQVPALHASWGSYGVNDSSAILNVFFEGSGDDYAQDKQVIDLLAEADKTVDAPKRADLLAKAVKRISEQAYWAPINIRLINYAYSKDVDFKPWPDENPRFFLTKWK